ncbi:MAG: hypothetical protein RL885_28750 [Planctomycetota bacterium]
MSDTLIGILENRFRLPEGGSFGAWFFVALSRRVISLARMRVPANHPEVDWDTSDADEEAASVLDALVALEE